MARKRKQQRPASPPTLPETDACIHPPGLATAHIVTTHARRQLGSLRHVVSSISTFLDCSERWTLESASDAGQDVLLDRLHARQWPDVSDTFLEARFLRNVRHATIKGNLDVLKWWWTKYLPARWVWQDMKETVVRIAAFHGHLPVLEWVLQDEKTLHTVANMNLAVEEQWLICPHAEIVYWIHNRSRRAKLFIILDEAIRQGDMAFLRWMHSTRDRHRHEFSTTALNKAAEAGHLEMLQFLREHEDDWFSEMLMHHAAKAGHLDLLKWLETTYFERELWMGRYKSPGSEAARNGHLDVVKWMVEECKVFLTDDAERLNWHGKAMDAAIEGGHWSVLRYLFENRPLRCTTRGLNLAIIRGDLEMAKWLHANGFQSLEDPMTDAAQHGHLAILQWLYETMPGLGTCVSVMDYAANLHIVKWLHENRSNGCSGEAMLLAAANGHLDMVEWFYTNRPEFGGVESISSATVGAVPVSAIDFAAAKGYMGVVKFLLSHEDVHCTTTAMDVAASSGHLNIVKWLHENRTEGCTVNAMNFAASNGYLNVVRWLHENRSEGCTVAAVDVAASHGHVHVVRWLLENRKENFSNTGLNHAVMNGQLDILTMMVSSQTGPTAIKDVQGGETDPPNAVEAMYLKRPDLRLHWAAAEKAASQDHFKVVEWMEKYHPDHVYNWMYRALEHQRDQAKNAYSNLDKVLTELYAQNSSEDSDDEVDSES